MIYLLFLIFRRGLNPTSLAFAPAITCLHLFIFVTITIGNTYYYYTAAITITSVWYISNYYSEYQISIKIQTAIKTIYYKNRYNRIIISLLYRKHYCLFVSNLFSNLVASEFTEKCLFVYKLIIQINVTHIFLCN